MSFVDRHLSDTSHWVDFCRNVYVLMHDVKNEVKFVQMSGLD